MRLLRARLHNLDPIREADLDFTALRRQGDTRPRLISVEGEHGTGKSTLIEAILPGALYRRMPTRGSLLERARGSAFVEVTLDLRGDVRTLRHQLDETRGEQRAYALNQEGVPLGATQSGGVRDFDAWVKAHAPAPSLVYASLFGPALRRTSHPLSSGFLGLGPTARKAALLHAAGIDRFARMCKRAGESMKQAASCSAELRRALQSAEARSANAKLLAEKAMLARQHEQAAAEGVSRARARLHAATPSTEVQVQETRRRELHGRIEEIRNGLLHHRTLVAQHEEVLAARAAEATVRGTYKAARFTVEGARERATTTERDLLLAEERFASVERENAAARAARIREEARCEDHRGARAAAFWLEQIRCERAVIRDEQARLRAEEDLLRRNLEEARSGIEDRMHTALWQVLTSRTVRHARGLASQALLDANAARARRGDIPCQLMALRLRQIRLHTEDDQLAVTERSVGDLARHAPSLAAAQKALEEALAQEARTETGLAQARVLLADARERHAFANHGWMAASKAYRLQEDQLEKLLATLQQGAAVEASAAHIAILEAEEARVARDLEEMPPPPAQGEDPSELRRDVASAEQDHRAAMETRAGLEESCRVATAAQAELDALREEHAAHEEERADWALLQHALGPDGVQAEAIDEINPILSATANDLLWAAYGRRYTIRFETNPKALASGDDEGADACEVMVFDAEANTWFRAEALSSGQEVLIELAASLAIGIFACERGGIERPTLVRDESDAALRPEYAQAYANLLREGASRMHADTILVVSWREEVRALADARIVIEDGIARLISHAA